MAKRKRTQDADKMLKEGRGTGRGLEYKPWLRIQDVPSIGRATRLKGIKTGRQHEFLSDMERNYFYLLEYSENVIDIREQYPLLPIEETLIISEELKLDHPKHPKTKENIVMTKDFPITLDNNVELAKTIKPKDNLLDRRVMEKFEIERVYWERKGIDLGIVTEQEIDKTIAHNISYVQNYRDISNLDCFSNIEKHELKDLIYEFIKRVVDDERTMRSICTQFDSDMSLEKGSSLSIFRYLVINKIIEIDITQKIDVNKRIYINNVREEFISKVEAI